MESTENATTEIEDKVVEEKQETEDHEPEVKTSTTEDNEPVVKTSPTEDNEPEVTLTVPDEVKSPEKSESQELEVSKNDADIFENVSDEDEDMFAKPKVDTDEVIIKSLPTESDLFDDVSEGGDLFDDKTPIKEEESKEEDIFGIDEDEPKDDKDDLAGIDDKDLFTGSAQQCDLFDDDDEDDTIESDLQGTMAIPVRLNSG
jgi:hypothetical protein